MSDKKVQKLVVSALMAALTYVATMVVQIPSPMNGYVNLGDCFVLLSGWLLGPWYGGAAAGIQQKGAAMRLDKYLKVSRLIKRRTVANEACDAGRVVINGKVAKASADVKAGDVIEIAFGNKSVKVRVTDVKDTVKKEEAADMFEYL